MDSCLHRNIHSIYWIREVLEDQRSEYSFMIFSVDPGAGGRGVADQPDVDTQHPDRQREGHGHDGAEQGGQVLWVGDLSVRFGRILPDGTVHYHYRVKVPPPLPLPWTTRQPTNPLKPNHSLVHLLQPEHPLVHPAPGPTTRPKLA